MLSVPDFVAFDLETTGLSPKSDEIIEIGAVRFGADLRLIERLELIVDPGRSVPLAVQRLTGLVESDLAGAPSPVEAVAQFADFADGARLVGHGAGFDLAFLASHLPGYFGTRPVHDTLELARILMPVAPSHSLPQLSHALELPHDRPHRAGSDAEATWALFGRLAATAQHLPTEVLAAMRRLVVGMSLPLAEFLLDVIDRAYPRARPDDRGVAPAPAANAYRAASSATARAQPSASAVIARSTDVAVEPSSPASGDSLRGLPLAAAAAAALGPGGPFATGIPEYELRESQVEMARAVGQTLERSGRLLVDAGTGIGKSLAYLVPLALWAAQTGRRSVVATNTVTLQEQLGDRDLPTVVERLGLDISHAVLKGRQHYISLRRWTRFLANDEHGPHGAGLEVLRFKLKVLCWLAQTATGDRTELRLAGADEALWRRVQSDGDDCLGSACANWSSGRCFMVAARRDAADSDIVVTNHALVLADSERQGQVLAPYSALVIDEAHRLEEAATQQYGSRLRLADVVTVLDRLGIGKDADGPLERTLVHCREGAQRLFGDVKGYLGELTGSDSPANVTAGITDELRSTPGFERIARSAWHALRTTREAGEALLAARGGRPFQGTFLPQPERIDDELELAAAALGDAALVIERVLLAPRAEHVVWLALRAEQAELHEAPIDVAEQLRGGLFERADATVLTSATMAVAGSFDFVRARTGVGEGAEELMLQSPFDYLAQALCVLATDMPPYDDPAYDAAMTDLCTDIALRLGGRTLVLFTGYSPLRAVHANLGPRLEAEGIAVLGQGLDGTRRQVLASFIQNPRTVLLGTSTFWEGIDVPGEALSCVVIAKLPFPVPSDPLVQARGARLRDPFTELALPTAVLRLKQGFGRLIRRGDDRGAVVLGDARVASRDYGATFLAALPEARIVRSATAHAGALVEDFVRHGRSPETIQDDDLLAGAGGAAAGRSAMMADGGFQEFP